ncbi:MAG TPA: M28 family peptidase [Methylibium sp.]|nr:M28 family peptidase [Methylibium sp.]
MAAIAAIGAALLAACGGGGDELTAAREAPAGSSNCEGRRNDTVDKLLACVTLQGVRAHQAALQQIADANNGTRAAGTPGYDGSLDYVRARLVAAGYQVSLQGFPYTFFPASTLQQVAPVSATHETGSFTGSGDGSVTADVVAVDINLAPPRDTTSGCEAADFTGFPAGAIALVQRGTCTFAVKVLNAEAAGASAVIIFNQGNTPDREGLIVGSLTTTVAAIPVVGASFASGVALAQPASRATVTVPLPQPMTQYNLLAESAAGDPGNVVMAGAHLDSVLAGPGINDNGSGTAALLEVALQMAKAKPRNKLRFAWWGAAESGLTGSTAYVTGLSEAQRRAITLYLDFDAVGSPNHVFFVYDGDNSDAMGAGAGPEGSEFIEQTFARFYRERSIPFKGTDFSGGSDYGPFVAVGIPSGGLTTVAEGLKTAEEASIWGGTAGIAYDPCYHLACDTLDNNNDRALDVNADAIAYAMLKYAMNTSEINNARSKGNFKKLIVPYPPIPAQ